MREESQSAGRVDRTAATVDEGAPVVEASELVIAAPPETVWDVLAGIESWPAWNLKWVSIDGARISPIPLLLVSTGGSLPAELDANRVYAEAAREPVELWELPDVNHTAAIRERPREYEQRVVGFFDDALERRRGGS